MLKDCFLFIYLILCLQCTVKSSALTSKTSTRKIMEFAAEKEREKPSQEGSILRPTSATNSSEATYTYDHDLLNTGFSNVLRRTIQVQGIQMHGGEARLNQLSRGEGESSRALFFILPRCTHESRVRDWVWRVLDQTLACMRSSGFTWLRHTRKGEERRAMEP